MYNLGRLFAYPDSVKEDTDLEAMTRKALTQSYSIYPAGEDFQSLEDRIVGHYTSRVNPTTATVTVDSIQGDPLFHEVVLSMSPSSVRLSGLSNLPDYLSKPTPMTPSDKIGLGVMGIGLTLVIGYIAWRAAK